AAHRGFPPRSVADRVGDHRTPSQRPLPAGPLTGRAVPRSLNMNGSIARLVLLVAIIAAMVVPAAAANGVLRVTALPSGALVAVDGIPTGKVTPMSITLPVGDHAVTVSIPGPGWTPSTQTVTIAPGGSDLSVTLVPTVTVGPVGPKGDRGDPGPPGP